MEQWLVGGDGGSSFQHLRGKKLGSKLNVQNSWTAVILHFPVDSTWDNYTV